MSRAPLFRIQRAGLPASVAALLALAPGRASAEQFVLFDVMFTYTWEDAINSMPSQSHYYVTEENGLNTERPTDWTSPVDYRNGTVHIRTEVIDKPAGGEVTQWTYCYIPNQGQGNGYGCTGSGTYTEAGVYEDDVSMTSWWENESIIWTEGIDEMHLVMKDSNGGNGHIHYRPDDRDLFVPTTMRITLVQVSAGSTYDPSIIPGLPGAEADAGAQVPPPQGGAGGAGGASGAGSGAGGGSGAPAMDPVPLPTAGASGGVSAEPAAPAVGSSGASGAATASAGAAPVMSTTTVPAASTANTESSCAVTTSDGSRTVWLGLAALSCLLGRLRRRIAWAVNRGIGGF